MLRTTREPAARLLESAGEADALRARHAQWCAGLGVDSPFPTYHPTLVQEAANIRAALTWTVQREQVDTNAALSLANAMHHAWATNRANAEALTCYEQVLGLGGGQPGLRALALCHAGVHARRLGQVAAAVSFVEQAREIATQIDDPTMQRLCVAVEADLDLDRGDLESAQRLLEQLMWLNCDNCCKTAIAASLAMVYVEQADTERAADLVAPWLGSLEDPACAAERASLLRVEAAIAAAQDSFSRAEWSLSQAVEAALAVGDSSEALLALRAQTDLARRRGLGATARRTARKALAIAPSLDGALARIRLLETCALALGGPAGAPLAHFAGHQRRQLGFAYWPSERASLAIFDISHPQLAPNSIQAALDSASELLGPEQRGEDLANGLTASLTPREREVARLLAAGSNTRQIADALVISGATARAHLEHIRTKLGVATRGDVAARLAFESPLSTS
jgi:non-specific serine/threonine protein kinase